ncbi:tRNA pseudouridine(55) synthase TruB [Pseudidiomarina mangrovi]|uniref:tRNA pseudouridine(55) synthase TruB n=1 Tax=Pseudidiomarina mangrovi TaxID=2487133 RepID=UPI000FCA8F58|nr:tRNA pseudouridine(55) synthase TruB [Pseudidiomarina mangrovi]CAI8153868.1 MAG: tRNA pseudouridine synthase B [Pseudidiomarina mangrovi]
MGRRKSGRNVNGVILLDKPKHLSSNAALQQVRRFFNANKAGHTGALDPLATGWLPLCFGEATKVSHYCLEADKRYVVMAQLGVRTTTSDAEGEVVAEAEVNVTEAQLQQVIGQFIGPQQQSPSIYSALKHEGKPLYYYARLGIEVPRKTRDIVIRAIDLLSFDGQRAELEVTCSKGTYIRTLVDDIGQQLGCGAHVAELRRTWIEGVEGQLLTLEQVAEVAAQCNPEQGDYAALDALLAGNDAVVRQLPSVQLDNQAAQQFMQGMPITLADLVWPAESLLRVWRESDNALLGVAVFDGQRLLPKRVMNDVASIAQTD